MTNFKAVWKNRLGKFIDNPKAVFPFLKKRLYYNRIADSMLPHYKDFHYLNYEDTMNTVLDKNVSIVRFGDELFDMLQGIGLYYGNWRQKYDKKLADRMKEVISSKDPRLLVCFNPELILKTKKQFEEMGIPEQWHFWTNSKIFLKDYYHTDVMYGSALSFTPRYNPHIPFKRLGDFFKTKDIVIVTSNISRFEGMNLGKTTSFIEAPASDAWQQYDLIYNKLLALLKEKNFSKENTLIMISMGSAAKVLTYDMTIKHDYRAWDTGQFFDLAFKEIQKLG